jgi:predicted DNA-binding transcriptional regulator YafY
MLAWCELRGDFRSFRTDRVTAARFLEERYPERPAMLRARYRRMIAEKMAQMGYVQPGGGPQAKVSPR